VRAQVEAAWKREKAAELAKKRAEEVAKKAEASGQSLTDFFAGDANVKVIKTDHFSWWTSGDVPLAGGQLRMSSPEGIVAAGPDFHRAVFELGEGKVVATQSHDRTMAYVIRLVEHEMSEEKLHDVYLSEASTWPAYAQMVAAHRQSALRTVANSVYQAEKVEIKRRLDPVIED
jgi:hypothetical protein